MHSRFIGTERRCQLEPADRIGDHCGQRLVGGAVELRLRDKPLVVLGSNGVEGSGRREPGHGEHRAEHDDGRPGKGSPS